MDQVYVKSYKTLVTIRQIESTKKVKYLFGEVAPRGRTAKKRLSPPGHLSRRPSQSFRMPGSYGSL